MKMRLKFIIRTNEDSTKFFLAPTLGSWGKIQEYHGRVGRPWYPCKPSFFARKREEKQ